MQLILNSMEKEILDAESKLERHTFLEKHSIAVLLVTISSKIC